MITDGQPFEIPWLIQDSDFDLFTIAAEQAGYTVKQFAEPGECIAIGSAEADIPEHCHGIMVSGQKYSGKDWMQLGETFDRLTKERNEASVRKETS